MSLQSGIYYVQMKNGKFLTDSEWDGDSFGDNPHYAVKRSEPWFDGGRIGSIPYTCTRVRLWFDVEAKHDFPVMKSFQTGKGGVLKTRFRAECPRCKWSTKSYVQQMQTIEMWNSTNKEHECKIERWEILP